MTEEEKNNIVQLMKDTMSANQINFSISYLRNGKRIPATAKELKVSPQSLYVIVRVKQVQSLLKMMELEVTEGASAKKDSVPTLEYLSEQWDVLYKRALYCNDDKAASQILDKRMKYYEMFEELRKEDKMNLSKLTIKELLIYENDRHEKTVSLLSEGKNNDWKDQLIIN